VHALVTSFEKRSGHPVGLHEAFAYDAVLAIAQAANTAGITNKPGDLAQDREKIRSALDGITIKGITGTWQLDAKAGEVARPYMAATVRNGAWQVELLK